MKRKYIKPMVTVCQLMAADSLLVEASFPILSQDALEDYGSYDDLVNKPGDRLFADDPDEDGFWGG